MRRAGRLGYLAARSSPAFWALPCLLGLELGVVMLMATDWTAEWRWAVDWAGAGVFLAGPLTAGLAAWQAQMISRTTGEAVMPLRAQARVFAFQAGGVLVWATAAHALLVCVVVATAYGEGAVGFPVLTPVLQHVLFLAACLAVGFLAGQLSESRLLAPAVVVVLVFLVIQASNGALPTLWVEVAGATSPLAGLDYRPGVVLAQVGACLALVAIAASVARGVVRPVVRWAPLGTAALTLVVAAGWLSATEANRFTVAADLSAARECIGRAPRVCLLADSSSVGPAVQEALADLHAAAGPVAILPTTYVQVVSGRAPDGARAFVLNAGAVADGRASRESLVTFVAWNQDCLLTDDAPPSRAVELVSDLATVLLARAEPGRPDPDRLMRLFARLEPEQQDAWVADALAASDRCAFEEIPDWLDRT